MKMIILFILLFYDLLLTLQKFTTPSMTDLSGIPFPLEEGAMPRFPTSLQGTRSGGI